MSTVGVIGTGNIGGTLGRAFARGGYQVVFGSRSPEGSAAAGDTGAKVGTVVEAVAAGEVVVLALPGTEVEGFLLEHGAALDGKVVVDATNSFPGPVLNAAALFAAHAPGARYARAFSSQAWETFATPPADGGPSDLPFSSAAEDRETVAALIESVPGLRAYYLGADAQDQVDAAIALLFPAFSTRGRSVSLRIVTNG
ncbi:NADPH-dependent F420 reductase [Streptacidiphilus monticola]|uniref:NADPH-dependent F420 reductase n=1 Tax=Streptacidiphilus monticola TaxID=2161674 RepID=A0ABW1GBM0_9ACTN